jgi:hypothetical protein
MIKGAQPKNRVCSGGKKSKPKQGSIGGIISRDVEFA